MKRKLILLLTMCIAASVLTGCLESNNSDPYDLAGKTHSAITPVNRKNSAWPPALERVAQGNVDLIFIGDSITRGWAGAGQSVWKEYYGSRNAVNLGFGGDRTQNILWRLDNGMVDGINPKLAVLVIGTNNCRDNTPEQVSDGIKAICAKLRTKLPKTKILMLAIFPRGNSRAKRAPDQNAIMNIQWEAVNKISKMASVIADNKKIFYLDITDAILDENGVLTRETMPDLLHMSGKGYRKWAEAIEPSIKKLMGEK